MEQSLTGVGLCATCRYLHIIKSAKGSFFVMCDLSKTDGEFQKYPPLPVIACDGYQQINLSTRKDDEG